jgi:hypothetical protein
LCAHILIIPLTFQSFRTHFNHSSDGAWSMEFMKKVFTNNVALESDSQLLRLDWVGARTSHLIRLTPF